MVTGFTIHGITARTATLGYSGWILQRTNLRIFVKNGLLKLLIFVKTSNLKLSIFVKNGLLKLLIFVNMYLLQ